VSTEINEGGSAFPVHANHAVIDGLVVAVHETGMTLRDWFAGQALASMTVAPDYTKGPCNQAMAERAYVIADAMIAAREVKP
jgi:hypothetical protein